MTGDWVYLSLSHKNAYVFSIPRIELLFVLQRHISSQKLLRPLHEHISLTRKTSTKRIQGTKGTMVLGTRQKSAMQWSVVRAVGAAIKESVM